MERGGPQIGGLVVIAICASAASCTKSGSPQHSLPPLPRGQTLRVAAFPDYFLRAALDGFEAKTGNKVVVETYHTNEELLAQLAAGKPYDVIVPSSYAVEQLLHENKLGQLNAERIPNANNIPPMFRNPPFDPGLQHCVPYVWSLLGLGVQTNHPREARRDPTRWVDIFALHPPDVSGLPPKVAMLDDMRATMGVALRTLGYSASSQSPKEIAAAEKLLTDQLPRVAGYAEDTSLALASGKVDVALAWSTELFNLIRKQPDIRFVLPEEGTLLYVDYACVPQSAAQPDVAFALLNHLLDPYVAAETTNATMLATANQEARKLLDIEARWMWGVFESQTARSRAYEVLRDVGPARPAYEASWARIKHAIPAGGEARTP